jgi:sugar phosphate isomerase/epimerase
MRPLVALPVWPKAGSLVKALDKANEYGFDYVELSLDYPWPERLRGRVLEEVEEARDRYGLKLAVHAPWRDVALASPRLALREASLSVLEDCLSFASSVEALYFNLHVLTREAWNIEGVREEAERAALTAVKRLAAKARGLGVELTVENNPEPMFGVPTMIKPLLEVEGVELCLDVGHVAYANWLVEHRGMEPFKKEVADLEGWVESFRGRALVGHLHDYLAEEREFQDHLMPGAGGSDVERQLKLLMEAGCRMLLLEVHWAGKGKPAKFADLGRALKVVAPLLKGGWAERVEQPRAP